MLGLRFNRLVPASLAGGTALLAGCPGGGEDTESDTDTDSSGTDSKIANADQPMALSTSPFFAWYFT